MVESLLLGALASVIINFCKTRTIDSRIIAAVIALLVAVSYAVIVHILGMELTEALLSKAMDTLAYASLVYGFIVRYFE